jgi:hypothetical protein
MKTVPVNMIFFDILLTLFSGLIVLGLGFLIYLAKLGHPKYQEQRKAWKAAKAEKKAKATRG